MMRRRLVDTQALLMELLSSGTDTELFSCSSPSLPSSLACLFAPLVVNPALQLAFHGAEYKHSVSARNLQAMYRVARLDAPAAAQLAAEGAARAAEKASRDAAAAAEEKAARTARRAARAAGGAVKTE